MRPRLDRSDGIVHERGHRMRSAISILIVSAFMVGGASAAPLDNDTTLMPARTPHDPWRVDWLATGTPAPSSAPLRLAQANASAQQPGNQPVHAAAVMHSDAYPTRAKIHP